MVHPTPRLPTVLALALFHLTSTNARPLTAAALSGSDPVSVPCTISPSSKDMYRSLSIATDPTCAAHGIGCVSSSCRYCRLKRDQENYSNLLICSAIPGFLSGDFDPFDVNDDVPAFSLQCATTVSDGDAAVGIDIATDVSCTLGGIGCLNDLCRYCKKWTTVQSAGFVMCSEVDTNNGDDVYFTPIPVVVPSDGATGVAIGSKERPTLGVIPISALTPTTPAPASTTPAPTTVAPTTAPPTFAPVTTAPVTTIPSTIDPVTVPPVTTAPPTTAPPTTRPPTTSPPTAAPSTFAPVTTPPPTTAAPTIPPSATPATTTTLTAAPTTAPPTTRPPTTSPPTAAPSTFAPATTPPPTTAAPTIPPSATPATTTTPTAAPTTAPPVTTIDACAATVSWGDKTVGISAYTDAMCRSGGLGCFTTSCRFCKTFDSEQSSYLLACPGASTPTPTTVVPVPTTQTPTPTTQTPPPTTQTPTPTPQTQVPTTWTPAPMTPTPTTIDACAAAVSFGDNSVGIYGITDKSCLSGGLGCFSTTCRFCKTFDSPQSSYLHPCASTPTQITTAPAPTIATPTPTFATPTPTTTTATPMPTTPTPTPKPATKDACAATVSSGDNYVGISAYTDSTCYAGGLGCFTTSCRFCQMFKSIQSTDYLPCPTLA